VEVTVFRSRRDQSRRDQAADRSKSQTPRAAAAREAALEALGPKLAQARDAIAPPLASARDRLAPRVETALGTTRQVANDRVLPAAEVARERLTPVVNRAAEAILDAVLPAVTAATEAYEKGQALDEIRRRGEAAVATLRTEGPEFARRRWPLIVGLVLTGAAVGAAVGLVSRTRTSEPAWSPPPPPAAPSPPPWAAPPGAGRGVMGDLGAEAAVPADTFVAEPADDPGEVMLVEIDPAEAEATRSEQ
jgi:hypothetical protein